MQIRHPRWRVWLLPLIACAILGLAGAGASTAARLPAPATFAGTPPTKPTAQPVHPGPPPASQDSRHGGPLALPPPPERAGGPDAFGYVVSDSREPNGPVFNYLAAPTLVLTGDDEVAVTTLPFPITIYDRTTYTLTVNTNGLVYLGHCQNSSFPCSDNYQLPHLNAPAATIAPIWDDLVLTGTNAGVFAGVFGVAPTRSYVLEWRNANFYEDPASGITAEVVFHENSNEIDFQYLAESGTLGSGSTASIGIENLAGTIGLPYSYHEAVLVPSLAVRYLALVSPGDQAKVAAPCSNLSFTGLVYNPFTTTTTFQLSVADSNPQFSSVVTPTTSSIQAGDGVPFTVGLTVPPQVPVTTTNVTTLTVTSTNPAAPLVETVHLTTQVQPAAADFAPDQSNGTGQAGNTLTYTLHLTNRVGPPAAFQITGSGNNWPSSIAPTSTGTLAAGTGVTVTVHVTIPNGSPLGESDLLVVTAMAQLSSSCAFSGTATITTFNNNQVGRQPLLEPRARHALVDFPANGRTYQIGGVSTDNNRALPIEEYDSRSDTWLARSGLRWPVSNVGGAAIGDTIYVPGGFDGTNAVRFLQTYQPASDSAAVVTSDPLPEPRYGAGVVAWAGKLYVIGGASDDSTTQTVYVYDPAAAGARWSRAADLPTARAFLGAAVLDGRIYAVGGIGDVNNPVDLATVEIYDPGSNTWHTGSSLRTPRGGLAVIGCDSNQPCGGYLYAFGGGWLDPLASAERYSPATETWVAIAPLSVPRRTLAAAYSSNDHLLLITGGYDQIELATVDAVGCGGALPSATPTPPGGVPTFTPTPVCTVPFSDVSPADYFYPAVRYLSCTGVIAGYNDGTFRPYAQMTRGQLSKIVVLSEDLPLITPAAPHFSDVPPSNPFYLYVESAYAAHLISGYAGGTFAPFANVTRSQIAKIIVLAQGWVLQNPSPGNFSDVPPGSPFFTFVETAFAHGILSGYADGTFQPYTPATRGQVSKIFYLALGAP